MSSDSSDDLVVALTVLAAGEAIDLASDSPTRSETDFATLRSLLTPKRVELLRTIHSSEPDSISQLADTVDRSYSPVHGDVQFLVDRGLLALEDGSSRGSKPVLASPLTRFVASDATSIENSRLPAVFDGKSGESVNDDGPQRLPERQEDLSAWIDSPAQLDQPDDGYSRGDVVWIPSWERQGRGLVILSHSLPDSVEYLSGVNLSLQVEDAVDTDLLSPDDWDAGGPGITVASEPWHTLSFHRSDVDGRIGTLDPDVTNSISLRMQVFLGPTRK